MLTFVGRRLLQLIPTLFFVSVIIFSLQHLLPGDPALVMGREMAKMANGASLDLLAYLLSLVVLEADSLNASELAARSEDPPLQD